MDTHPLLDDTFPLPLDAPFTRREAIAAGITDNRLARLTASGRLRRPIRNVYVRPADEGRLRNDLTRSGERTVRPEDLMELRGLIVTTPIRTAWDLGRLQRRDQALSGLDAMLRLGGFSHHEMVAGVEQFARQRGVRQLRVLAPLADGRAASPGESALRLRWYDAGLPRPELQIPVIVDGVLLFLLDLGLEDLLFAAEYDGREWHSSAAQQEHDQGRRSWLETQRLWQIEAFGAVDVYGRHQHADLTLRAAYQRARASIATRRYVA